MGAEVAQLMHRYTKHTHTHTHTDTLSKHAHHIQANKANQSKNIYTVYTASLIHITLYQKPEKIKEKILLVEEHLCTGSIIT